MARKSIAKVPQKISKSKRAGSAKLAKPGQRQKRKRMGYAALGAEADIKAAAENAAQQTENLVRSYPLPALLAALALGMFFGVIAGRST